MAAPADPSEASGAPTSLSASDRSVSLHVPSASVSSELLSEVVRGTSALVRELN